MIRCLPLTNEWNVSLQILGYCRSPANEKPKDYQKNNRQHPHHSPTCHIWNTLSRSGQEYLQNPEKFRQCRIKKSTSSVGGIRLSFYCNTRSLKKKKINSLSSDSMYKNEVWNSITFILIVFKWNWLLPRECYTVITENISYAYVRDMHLQAVLSSCFVHSISQWKTSFFERLKVISIKQQTCMWDFILFWCCLLIPNPAISRGHINTS